MGLMGNAHGLNADGLIYRGLYHGYKQPWVDTWLQMSIGFDPWLPQCRSDGALSYAICTNENRRFGIVVAIGENLWTLL